MTSSLPEHGPVFESRQVLVSVAPNGKDEVTMRVDVQEVWIPTRMTWSYVPRTASSVTATVWTGADGTKPQTATSTSPSTVATLRRLVNAMPVSTAGVTSCPADTGQRFRLEFGGTSMTPFNVFGLTAECGGISLSVAGQGRLGLTDTGGRVVAAIEALAGGR
jgi:hypothetical protein